MLNVITLFSGYDSQCLAINRLGIPYDLVAWAEIDKHACTAHDALFPQFKGRNVGDVSRVDWAEWHSRHPEPIDLLTYSSPCQDFSSAGLQRGGEEGSGTRIFMVSILDCSSAYYFPKPFPLTRRLKDVLEQNVDERYYLSGERVAKLMQETAIHRDRGNGFAFRPHTPEEIASTVKCSGIGDKTDNFVAEPQMLGWSRNEKGEITDRHPVNVANCVTAAKRDNTQNYVMEHRQWHDAVAVGRERTEEEKQRRHIHGDKGAKFSQGKQMCVTGDVSGCITTFSTKDNLCAEKYNLLIPQATKEGYAVVPEGGVFDASYPDSKTRRGRVQEGGTVSPTIMASQNELLRYEGIRIRRLTERELYRLMDVSKPDIDTLLAAPIPRTQHAKLAGNSIVVACLYYIFRNLFVNTEPEAGTQTKLF